MGVFKYIICSFLYERFLAYPQFICLLNHVFISGWTYRYLCYSLNYKPIRPLLILLLKSFQLWSLGVLLCELLCLSDMLPTFLFLAILWKCKKWQCTPKCVIDKLSTLTSSRTLIWLADTFIMAFCNKCFLISLFLVS